MSPEERAAKITKGWGAIHTSNFVGPGSAPPEIVIANGGEVAKMLIADAIHEAVAAERERCAKIAKAWRDPDIIAPDATATGCYGAWSEGCECSAPEGIAKAIREGGAS